ncbi:hypothetical protein LCGC14_0910810, partial [marine sediment metagenome]
DVSAMATDLGNQATAAEAHAYVEANALVITGGLQMSGVNITMAGAETVDGVDISTIVAFKTITGITNDIVADSLTDTLTFTAGAGLTIVGTAATDTITFTNTITQYTDGLARTATLEATDYPTGWDGDDNHAPTQDALYDLFNGKIFNKAGTFPGSPIEGQLYYDTVDEAMYRYSGDAQAWIQIGASGVGGDVYPTVGIASDDLIFSNDTERGTNSVTYVKMKEIIVYRNMKLRIYWEAVLKIGGSSQCKSRIYVNGVAIGSEHTADFPPASYPFTEDIEVNSGDLVQVYLKQTGAGISVFVKNMKIRGIDYISNDP